MNASDIAQITKALKNTPSAVVYLYGSQTKGKTHQQSDIDLAILPTDSQKYHHRYFSQKLLPLKTSRPLDVRILTPNLRHPEPPTYVILNLFQDLHPGC